MLYVICDIFIQYHAINNNCNGNMASKHQHNDNVTYRASEYWKSDNKTTSSSFSTTQPSDGLVVD